MKQVKFCGLTRPQDVSAAVCVGADAIGLVFYPPSPRAVDILQAKQLVANIPAFVSVVALVVNIDDDTLIKIAQAVNFDIIQFHGDETADECQRQATLVSKRWIKAVRVDASRYDTEGVQKIIDDYHAKGAASILLDAYHADKFGGTGERFDWSIIPKQSSLPIILAGGLTPNNVALTRQLPIYAVDVSGGIESAKGIKDIDKMRAFMKAVHG
ncbi:Phosphoribosylanthranilate isomerase [Moraxella catarrhalis]|uniref:phosphoribosylanthranilate isomerase n=1 Tax=Moraxella catarrhalis TaxID=480 RepID=UPI0007E2E907|nr:phosphoribosylanthranilate isomerase [Moraxella catarrhalis]OAV23008.1 Phosphoribosylanthranilate isomerase [Moraxella catarrhalis]